MLLYYFYVICLFTKIINKNLKGRGNFFFLFTKLATYGSNLCHSANVGNGLLAGCCLVFKRSTDKGGSSVYASPSLSVCLLPKTPTIDEAMNVLPIGQMFLKVLRAAWPFGGEPSSNYTVPPAAMCSVKKKQII